MYVCLWSVTSRIWGVTKGPGSGLVGQWAGLGARLTSAHWVCFGGPELGHDLHQERKGQWALGIGPSKTKIKYANRNRNENKVNTRLENGIITTDMNSIERN